ncbi:MAG: hypothetical protein RUDDFDWM_001544 [Candidatus Fervidibacterota bacterium]
MVVGICTLQLKIPESSSLKDKRRVIKSIMARIRNKFNVSVTEVDHQDSRVRAVLAVACVSNNRELATRTLSYVVTMVEQEPRVLIEDYSVELL